MVFQWKLFLAMFFCLVPLTHATSFNAVTDFSTSLNPNGPWSYGSTPSLGGTFSLLVAGSCGPLAGWNGGGATAVGDPPMVYGGTGTCGGGTLAGGLLDLHPGPTGQYSDVRWIDAASGTYNISGIFQGIDMTPTTTDVHVLLNGVSLFDS